jgi:hypothetical protein
MRRITAVAGITSEQWTIAKIFPATAAILAKSAGLAQPRHAHAPANFKRSDALSDHINPPDNFMTWYEWELGI